jgi:hypothetical protein
MLIYTTLGDKAQSQFAQTWGIGYGLDNATEWQEVLKTAAKTALILVVLDLLRLSKNASWFEVRKPAASSVLSALTRRAPRSTGARRFRVHAGRPFQWRCQVVVGADAVARAHAGAPDGGLSSPRGSTDRTRGIFNTFRTILARLTTPLSQPDAPQPRQRRRRRC